MKRGMKGILLCIAMIMVVMLAMVPAKTVHAAMQEGDIAGGVYDEVDWRITSEGELIIGDGTEQTFTYKTSRYDTSYPWFSNRKKILSVRFDGVVHGNGSMRYMFYKLENVVDIDLKGFETSSVTDMSYMFRECSKAETIDVSGFDTSNVTNMEMMFWSCSKVKNLDVGGFDTSNVKNMSHMFYNCDGVTELDVSKWNTSKVTNMYAMFMNSSNFSSLDLSSFDTSNVINMQSCFNGCSALKKLNLSNFDTSKVQYMNDMFYYCPNLEVLDISNFDTSNVTNMTDMFPSQGLGGIYKSSLRMVVLGPDFKFNGNNITTNSKKAILPSPTRYSIYLENSWVREDGAYGPLSTTSLRDTYKEDMAGTWVWAVPSYRGVIQFDANGGYTSASAFVGTSSSQYVQMPGDKTVRPHYVLTGWNTKADGSGSSFGANESVNGILSLGKTITLYAQWETTDLRDYKVLHYQQKTSLDGYSLADTEVLQADRETTVTPAVKDYGGFIKPEVQSGVVTDDDSLVIEYYYDRILYNIHFDGNGAITGQMKDLKMLGGIGSILPDNSFGRKGYIFTGWNTEPDGSGTTYTNGANIINLTDVMDSTVTLYAQWLDNSDHVSDPSQGAVSVQLKAGQTVVIPDLPAGTTYTIREVNNPDGWSFDHTDGETGTIQANKTNDATVYNVYHAVGSVPVTIYKDVVGPDGAHKDFEAGSFAFAIVRQSDAKVMGTAWNDSIDTEEYLLDEEGNQVPNPHYGLAAVEFQPLTFDESDIGKTYTYLIGEINTPEGYDVSEPILLTVKVEDAGHGQLNVIASYDHAQKIVNTDTQSGTLRISKDILNAGANNAEFTFKVDLKDAEGNPLAGTYRAGIVGIDNNVKYSHTENINDSGEKQGDYVSNKYYTDVVTIPGVEKLHVTVKYTNPRGQFYIWQGAHEEVHTQYYSSDFSPNTALKNYVYQSGKDQEYLTDEFDVEGDSLSVLYTSYAYSENNTGYYSDMVNYGYYLTVSGSKETFEGNTDFHSGDTVTLHGGEHIDIYDLPVGATYSVSEINIPERWGLISSVGENGTIPNGQTVTASFINSYGEELTGVAYLTGQKKLTGKDLTAGEFLFEVVDSEGNPVSVGTNDATGKIAFEAIPYTESQIGEHQYTVREVIPEEHEGDGITYDEKSYAVTVNVSKGDNTLVCDVSYPEDVVFNNTYTASTEITVSGQKVLEGRDFRESDKWTFTISGDGPLPEQPSVDIRPYQFDRFGFTIPFTVADLEGQQSKEFTYTVKESGSVVFVANDKSEKTFTVRVTDNGQGVLKAELLDADNLDLTFTNKATVTLPATGSTAAIVLTIVGVVVIAGGLFFLLRKKKDDDEDE